MISNQEIIDAYLQTGSVWKAAKVVGLSGQTVHERLKALGHKLPGSEWSEEEIAELTALANQMTIAQIANRLGRPYNGVALKISRLGLGQRFGNKQSKKIPRTGEYTKEKVSQYLQEIEAENLKVTTFSRKKGLKVEALVTAIQRHNPEWYEKYCEKHAVKPKTNCPYCGTEFWPLSHKQINCSRKCSDEARVDNSYFGGRRRETIGLLEGICQLCGNHTEKGLSSHHILGKENDPDNEHLIALCSGCHQIVTIVAGRRFAATEEAWEVLIQLVIMRKNGHDPDFRGVYTTVSLEMITAENEHLYLDDE
jgi:5-methylcytosine-specific restriction endonuclease McrA